VQNRYDRLHTWRKDRARLRGVESDVILPKVYLGLLSENPPKNMDDLKSMMVDSPWRFEQYGKQLLKLVGG